MGRIIIHKINVSEVGAKLQFQIKLPRDLNKIRSIKVTSNTSNILSDITASKMQNECGNLWLRIADHRDVFYAQRILYSSTNFDDTRLTRIYSPSIGNGEKWFNGSKEAFFKVDVAITNTIIEGYYTSSVLSKGEYQVTIYLETE